MSGDLVRARAASVLDVLGDDFWAWWRTGVSAGLVVLLLAMALAAVFDTNRSPDLALLIKLLTTATMGAFMATVTYVSVKRLHRWRQLGALRRLPVAESAPRWDASAFLLLATLAWMGLATWACSSVVTSSADENSAGSWVLALLLITAGAAAFGRWERSLWSQGLAMGLTAYISLGMDSVAQMVEDWKLPHQLAILTASALVLTWSLLPNFTLERPSRATWAWDPRQALAAWYRSHIEGRLHIIPLLAMGSAVVVAPFVSGLSSERWLWVWLTYQFMVLTFCALSWSAPQHWRQRLVPKFERQRHWLAIRLWWGQCAWLIPICAVFALLSSPWTLYWPRVPAREAYLAVGAALPWLVANLAMLMAALTLWIGLRRGREHWDWIFAPVWIATLAVGQWEGRSVLALNIAWSGRIDLLLGMVTVTALLLALATWVWQRGSLAGMERWSLTGRMRDR